MFEHDEKDGSYHYLTVFLCLVKGHRRLRDETHACL